MKNLLNETIDILVWNNHHPRDVRFVSTSNASCTWEEFVKLADREYDNGYGGTEVAEDLVVVGKNWWLERHEYDGSEWWEHKTMPKQPGTGSLSSIRDIFPRHEDT